MEEVKQATRLKIERVSRGLKLADIAQLVGVSSATVSNWEKGETYPDIDKAIELSRYYDVPIKELFSDLFLQ